MNNSKATALTATLCGICLILAGCSAGDSADVPDNVTSAATELMALPAELFQASDMIAAQCMRAKGYDIPTSLASYGIGYARGYADIPAIFLSEEDARRSGYPSATVDHDKGVDFFDAYAKKLDASQQKRFGKDLNGEAMVMGPDACFYQAFETVFGSFDRYVELASTFNEYSAGKARSTLRETPVQQAILAGYVPCMVKAGYAVKGLNASDVAAQRFGAYRLWNERPNDSEQAMAVQDFTCQRQANLHTVVKDALERTAGQWMLNNEALLLERHEKLNEAKDQARAVISGAVSYHAADDPRNGGAS